MNQNPNQNPNRRGRRKPKHQPVDFWREPELPEPDLHVTPAADVTAALRSLGPPPLPGQGGQAEQSLAAVVLRASSLAMALAAAAGLDTSAG